MTPEQTQDEESGDKNLPQPGSFRVMDGAVAYNSFLQVKIKDLGGGELSVLGLHTAGGYTLLRTGSGELIHVGETVKAGDDVPVVDVDVRRKQGV